MTDADAPRVRPRQHVLEDLSEREFSRLTPDEWVVRPVPKDYGIDYEVEIFDDGRRTGLTLKVQLKSTDDTAGGLSVRLSDFDYWSTLDVPVLLVLYRAKSDEVFSSWAHAHNPWPQVREDQKTTTVHFAELYSDHLARIPTELEQIREVKARATKMPVSVGVKHPHPAKARDLRSALREIVDRYDLGRIVNVVNNDPYVAVTITSDQISATAPANAASTTVHGSKLANVDDPADAATNILILVSMLLSQVRSDRAAAQLLAAILRDVGDDMLGSFAKGVATTFARDQQWEAFVAVLDVVMVDPEVTGLMYDIAQRHARHMTAEAALQFIDFGRRSAAELLASDRSADASQRYYISALIGVDHDLWDHVGQDLVSAAAALPGFYDRDARYHELVGKAHWNTGERAAALDHYEQAWNLGWQSEQSVAIYAEALFVNGKYGQARDHLTAADPDLMTRWSRMTQCFVTGIIDITGVAEQESRPFSYDDPGDIDYDTVTDPDVLLKGLRERDASNPALMARYLQATDFNSLGAGVWVAANIEERTWWLWAIGAAHQMEAPEATARAIIETAALEFPDIGDRLHELGEDENDPIDPAYIEWARIVAEAPESYVSPPAKHEDGSDRRVRITDVEPTALGDVTTDRRAEPRVG